MKNQKQGFTLIELLVVVAIIIILAAILLPYLINRVEDSRISRMIEEIRSLKTAVLLYYNDLSIFPNTWDDLVSNGPTNANWRGPYIEKIPPTTTATWNQASPWKTNYRIIVQDNAAGFNFAGQAAFNFTRGIGLEVTNPETPPGSGVNVISTNSLNKIDTEMDNGSATSGLIIGGAANATSLSAIAPASYSTVNASVYILLQGIR
ncbi:MAG: prepilin-type N-terminal cleavage/methylation domain-containing protein [bacterium]